MLEYLFWRQSGRRRRAIGVREEPTSTSITGQLAPPPIPSETNDEATSSQPQSPIESQNLLIAGGQFSNVRGHYTNIVLNVNPTSENTLTIQGSPSSPLPSSSNETDHISSGPTSSRSAQPSHERTSPRTEVNQTIFPQKSNDIYERHLILKGRGFPLWIPDPNQVLYLDYRRTGVRIGDVGIINHSGGFSFLFNICLPHDHPVNPRILPEHFAPISPPIEATDIEKFVVFKNGSHLASASIKRLSQSTAISGTGGSVFESSASEGAILIMPRGARCEDLGNFASFRKYAAANVADWYKFVNGPRGREAKNGDVRLVVGFDKTTSWGIATFVNQAQQNSCRLKFGPSEGDSGSTYTWSENSGVTDVRAGPDSDESDELRIDSDPPDFQFENQCLFVRTLNVTLTDDVWADIHSTLGSVHVDPRHVRDHSSSNCAQSSSPSIGGGSNPSPSSGLQCGTQRATGSTYGLGDVDLMSDNNPRMFISGPPGRLMAHPSKVLNDMLLAKVPTAKMAITHDNDWCSVITQYNSTLADSNYNLGDVAENVLASREICEENGVVFLQPKVIPLHPRLSLPIYPEQWNSCVNVLPNVATKSSPSPMMTNNNSLSGNDPLSPITMQSSPAISDLTLSPLYSSSPFGMPTTPASLPSFMPSPTSPTLSQDHLVQQDSQVSTTSDTNNRTGYTYREQLRLFREAVKLHSEGAGPYIPQSMYKPHITSDRKRYVEDVLLEPPIYFYVEHTGQCGLPLHDALHSRVKNLVNREQVVFEGRGPSVSIRLEWPGYRQWSRQIPTKDFRSPPGPITIAKLAKNVAKCVMRFMLDRKMLPMEDGADERWRIGDGPSDIKVEDLMLVSIHHVSLGSWQPQFRLCRPLSISTGSIPIRSPPIENPTANYPTNDFELEHDSAITTTSNRTQATEWYESKTTTTLPTASTPFTNLLLTNTEPDIDNTINLNDPAINDGHHVHRLGVNVSSGSLPIRSPPIEYYPTANYPTNDFELEQNSAITTTSNRTQATEWYEFTTLPTASTPFTNLLLTNTEPDILITSHYQLE